MDINITQNQALRDCISETGEVEIGKLDIINGSLLDGQIKTRQLDEEEIVEVVDKYILTIDLNEVPLEKAAIQKSHF